MSNLSPAAKTKMRDLIMLTAGKYGGVVGEQFAATPSIAQDLNDKIIQDGNPFLQRINVVPVSEIKGEKVMLGLSSRVTSRTDTSGVAERVPKDLVALDAIGYELFATETDVALRYATIDVWAKFPDFAARYGMAVRKAIGNDRLAAGWYGTSAAATTDLATNANLQDLNKGWLTQIETYNAGSQIIIGTGPAPIALGSAAFPNLDTVIFSAFDKLAEPFRSEPDLVALVSRNLLSAAEGKYYNIQGNTPTEKQKINTGEVIRTYGGLPVIVPPFLPDGVVLITSLDNLSIYWQDSSWRRQQKDKPEKNRYEDFNSRNEGYVVEQFNKCFYLKNVTIAP
ncbi:MAG: phage major capsid protein, P2 family [Methylococcales bacterium]